MKKKAGVWEVEAPALKVAPVGRDWEETNRAAGRTLDGAGRGGIAP